MPRPTAAQLSYGSVTVVLSTLAMLLLFRTTSGIGVAAVGTVALALGLAVSLTLPARSRRHTARAARTAAPVSAHRGTAPAARDEDRSPVSAQSLR
ncbi:hypothetical protein AB0L33_16335 [Streptomyces sp. NPDC052299]|uniref:hypothetical protein n=1 Tax=Streptomyces sp. NPDC052299 TaxID=3155054 RepID=UPI003413E506